MEFIEIMVENGIDGSLEPSLFAESDSSGKRPLIVFLHTWSFDRHNQTARLEYAKKHGFHILLPEFRGPNLRTNPRSTEACASRLAREDVKAAIDYVVAHYEVDTDNIFLVGMSGGGHMALMMAAYCPEYFRAVASFVPITNLEAWREYSGNYRGHIDACVPSSAELAERSPISHLDEISRANVKLFAGRWDRVVPYTETVSFYNAMVAKHPDAKIYIDIFDGGHEYVEPLLHEWLMSQYQDNAITEVTG